MYKDALIKNMQKLADKRLADRVLSEYELDTPIEINMQDIYGCALKMANHMGIRKKFMVVYSDKLGNIPARIQYADANPFFLLEINSEKEFNQNQIKAILAHELSHAFIMENDMQLNNDEYTNELYTDFIAVYLGFGKIMTRGSETYKTTYTGAETITTTYHLGYLTKQQIILARKLVYNRPKFWEVWEYRYISKFTRIICKILEIICYLILIMAGLAIVAICAG